MVNELLKTIIETMKERKTVCRIMQAKDVKSEYNAEKEALSQQIEEFRKLIHKQNGNPINIEEVKDLINEENALEIAFLFVIGKFELKIFSDVGVRLICTLDQLKEEQILARNLSRTLFGEFMTFDVPWKPKTSDERILLESVK